jgi:3',5'-cyclic AMP phosphodiesterase CpdA
MRILHLSDLHFGVFTDKNGKRKLAHFFSKAGDPDPTGLANVLFKDPELERAPDLVVISGDIGWSAIAADYAAATEFLAQLRTRWAGTPFVIVAGNHDVDQTETDGENAQEPFRTWLQSAFPDESDFLLRDADLRPREQLMTVRTLKLPGGDVVVVVGVNSAAHLNGTAKTPVYVRPEVLKAASTRLQTTPADALRIFVLHHHLLPFAEPHWQDTMDTHDLPDKPDPTIVGNSARLQTWLSENGFHVVLHGHKHQAHGRADRLWRRQHAGGEQLVVVGAGSASVERGQVSPEPHTYNIISTLRQSAKRWQMQIAVREVSDAGAYPQARALFDYALQTGPETTGGPLVFHTDRSDQCHALISCATRAGDLITNFISIIDTSEYQHPLTAELVQKSVTEGDVLRSFRALHPEYAVTEKWRNLDVMEAKLHDLSPRFQFQHGPRLFGLVGGGGKPQHRPIVRAVDRLKEGPNSKAFVSLFRRRVDVLAEGREPLPALMSLQFVRVDDRLDLVATFRKLELSFWWVVNVYEACELLHWAADRLRIKERRITFFAALAEWKTTDVDPAFVALLDELKLSEVVALVAGVARNEVDQLSRLRDLLDEKRAHTHAQNLDVAGLDLLVAVLKGLPDPKAKKAAKRELWLLHDSLVKAADHVRTAMEGRKNDATLADKGCEALSAATTILARQIEAAR